FKSLFAYSPYHNLKKGVKYPPTLITTANTDDRVVPAHSLKFAAQLQYCQGGSAPVMIRIETDAGHGGGKPTAKQIEEVADQWAFLVETLEMKLPAKCHPPTPSLQGRELLATAFHPSGAAFRKSPGGAKECSQVAGAPGG